MNRRIAITIILCDIACKNTHHVHSFQVQGRPKTARNLLTQHNVGFGSNPQNWSDVKPNRVEEPLSSKTLTPIESLWTKYGMIAYIAHMCAFLPLSLIPTYLQTKFGLLSKSDSEHQALQVGQKCAQTLLQWIPFMNVGESIWFEERVFLVHPFF